MKPVIKITGGKHKGKTGVLEKISDARSIIDVYVWINGKICRVLSENIELEGFINDRNIFMKLNI